MRVAVAFGLIAFLAAAGKASAIPIAIDVGPAPVVAVRLHAGTLTVRTWDRNVVRVVAQGRVKWSHADAAQVAARLHTTQTEVAQTAHSKAGPVTLPPESFVLPALTGDHDGVRIVGSGSTEVTVPRGTVLILARVMNGRVVLRGYRDGAFVAVVRVGSIALRGVSGTGFAQVLRGRIVADNSSFARLRARTAIGMLVFERCTAQQIQVTSIRGSIAYDDGSFLPGLARFETRDGNVALGIGSGGARITASGRIGGVYTAVRGPSSIVASGAGASGAIGDGSAAVTARTAHGKLLIYDGGLSGHPAIAAMVANIAAALQQELSH